jgi:hypothetical protein
MKSDCDWGAAVQFLCVLFTTIRAVKPFMTLSGRKVDLSGSMNYTGSTALNCEELVAHRLVVPAAPTPTAETDQKVFNPRGAPLRSPRGEQHGNWRELLTMDARAGSADRMERRAATCDVHIVVQRCRRAISFVVSVGSRWCQTNHRRGPLRHGSLWRWLWWG